MSFHASQRIISARTGWPAQPLPWHLPALRHPSRIVKCTMSRSARLFQAGLLMSLDQRPGSNFRLQENDLSIRGTRGVCNREMMQHPLPCNSRSLRGGPVLNVLDPGVVLPCSFPGDLGCSLRTMVTKEANLHHPTMHSLLKFSDMKSHACCCQARLQIASRFLALDAQVRDCGFHPIGDTMNAQYILWKWLPRIKLQFVSIMIDKGVYELALQLSDLPRHAC